MKSGETTRSCGYESARAQHERLEKKRARLLSERAKLLEAHYAGAIPLDLLKSEQARIGKELEIIAARTAETDDHQARVATNLKRAMSLASNCQNAYGTASATIRRLFNQVFFTKLYLLDDDHIQGELTPLFEALTPRAATVIPEPGNDNTPEMKILGGVSRSWWAGRALGLKEPKLVAGAGFEPATSGL